MAALNDLTTMSAADLAGKLGSGEVSSVEATQAHLDRIAAVDDRVHAFLHVSADALANAKRVDERRAAGESLGELAGVPVAIKDVLCTIDMPTTAGSKILEGWVPPYDATPVAKLRAAGLIPLGKTNMDEFAMGSSTEHSAYGPTRNPWDLDRIPGGSGGGSAAAVSAFETPLALGSDTGGSIRQPASVTGSVGVKPTYGGVSRYGAIALASSLDQVGPVSRTVLDSALLHDVIGGHDPLQRLALVPLQRASKAFALVSSSNSTAPASKRVFRNASMKLCSYSPISVLRLLKWMLRTLSMPSRRTTSSSRPRHRATSLSSTRSALASA